MENKEEYQSAGFPDALIRLGEFDFWPEDPFKKRNWQYGKMEHYSCKFFDKETRNCTNYEKRPQFCRTHGEEYACSYAACCRNDSMIVNGGVRRMGDKYRYKNQEKIFAKALPPSSGIVELPYPADFPFLYELSESQIKRSFYCKKAIEK